MGRAREWAVQCGVPGGESGRGKCKKPSRVGDTREVGDTLKGGGQIERETGSIVPKCSEKQHVRGVG